MISLTATATNAEGATVLVPTTDPFTWEVPEGGAFASVDGNGVVTGLAEGTATIRATEAESGVFGALAVIVTTNNLPPVIDSLELLG